MASATTGIPSFAKLFQMPLTSTASVARELENPHEPRIE
jgi:hypothetical protein